jgi:tetratricopeptide (TPR) repeat protein
VLVAEGRLDEAAVIFTQLWTTHGDPNIAFNLAYVRFRQGNYEAALRAVMPFTHITPAKSVALAVRALHHLGKYKEARAAVDKEMPRHGKNADFLAAASLVYLDEEDLGKADELAKKSLAAGQRLQDALVTAGTVSLAKQDTQEALSYFREALNMNSNDGRSLMGMGMAFLMAADAPNAKKYLERAVTQLPGSIDTAEALGWAQVMGGDLAQAEETFKKLLAKAGRNSGAHRGLAVTYAMQGSADQSRKSIAHLDANDDAVKMAEAILSGGSKAAEGLQQLVRRKTRLH